MKVKTNTYDISALRKITAYISPYKWVFLWVSFAAIIGSALAIAKPFFLQKAIDFGIFEKAPNQLIHYIILMCVCLFSEVFFQINFTFFSNWLGQHVVKDLRATLFDHISGFKMQYFDKTPVGGLVTRTVSDIEKISEIFSQGLFVIISDILKMVVIVLFMTYKNWKLTLLVLSVMPIILIATKVFHKHMKKAFEGVRSEVSNLNTYVQEHLSGMKIVQLFGQEKQEYEKFKAINKRHRNAWVHAVWSTSIFFPIMELCSSITIGLLVWYGGLQTLSVSSGLTLGIVTMFIQLTQMLFRPLRQIADKFNTLQMGTVAARRVFGVLSEDHSLAKQETKKIISPSLKGCIRFEEVVFSYNTNQPVLKGVSFTIEQGQSVAIVGATGAGKSTIINLLGRFYEIDSGNIYIDGYPIQDFNLSFLRSQVAIVLQDVFLFADSIFNNITFKNPEITKDQVVAAAKEIGIHEFISNLPGGYNYNVRERGGMLSTGQRQLIAFLRAYISQPQILILDEATSSVDSYTEELIEKATEKITQNRTSIIIAHRLATVAKANQIMVLEQGNLVEKGTQQELLNIKEGYYSKLYNQKLKDKFQNGDL